MTKHEFIRVLVRGTGVGLIGLAGWFTINFFGNLLVIPVSGAAPVYIHLTVIIVVLVGIGSYLIKDGYILFKLLDR
jgi:hypothetical protein